MHGASTDWFYALRPEEPGIGPVTFAELRRLTAEQTVTTTSYVRNDGSSRWVEAGLVPGLFSTPTGLPVTEASPPQQPRTNNSGAWPRLRLLLQTALAAVRDASLHLITAVRLVFGLFRLQLLSRQSDQAVGSLGKRLFIEKVGAFSERDELQTLTQTLEREPPLAVVRRRELERRRDQLFHQCGAEQLALGTCPESCLGEFQAAQHTSENTTWHQEQVVALKKALRRNDQSQLRRLLIGYALVVVALFLLMVITRPGGGGPAVVDRRNAVANNKPETHELPASSPLANTPPLPSKPEKPANAAGFLTPEDFRRDAQGNILTPWTHDRAGNQFALAKLGYKFNHCLLCGAKRSSQEQDQFSDKNGFGFCAACGATADALFVTRRAMEIGAPVSPEHQQAANRYGEMIAARQPLYAPAFLMWRDEMRWEEAWKALAVLTAGPNASQ